ncbi:MAG: efflux RND transporter permease subunit [Bacteroidetes bacterium]|nr:efflux RND transporter permease subunit [Bacteroidota bacterium]
MFDRFIERPVLSTVISILIVLLGVLGLVKLPIAQYPNIAPPTVQVSASYGGANAAVVLRSVIVPLEEAINGVEGMTYMTSSATNEGTASISVYFAVGTDPDQAAVNVQNSVAAATSLLPKEVTQAGVTVKKQQSSNLLIMSIYSDEQAFDQTFLQNYVAINLIPQLQRVRGVGAATVFGSAKNYAMRIWLKPDVMSQYGITGDDVDNALAQQNVEAAPGKFGENDGQSFQYVIKYKGRLQSIGEFGDIIIRATGNGQFLRLKDIARIELGAQTYTSFTTTDGKQSVGIAIAQTPGSNARDVINGSKAVLERAAASFPPGIHQAYLVDIDQFLDASIDKVVRTLVECFALVFLVIFLFLQDFRSTIIHGISVPVSITGTFFFLYLFGFSINLLTLFALVLAIGIVVDDAIVVVEAVHAKLESGYTSPVRAAKDAMHEISGAIISITLVMAAVFVPVTFITGSAGVFYQQFGITLAIAIIISAVNALTLCPALAALALRPPDHGAEAAPRTLRQRFSRAFNAGYDALTARYSGAVRLLAHKRWIVVVAIAGFAAGFYALMRTTPASFVPPEDMGVIFVNISLPPASSLERTTAVADAVDSLVRTVPHVQNVMRNVGQNFIAGSGSSYAMLIVKLDPWDQRKGVTNDDVIKRIMQRTAGVREGRVLCMSLPTITGFGISGGFTFQLQDKGGHTTDVFYKVAQDFLAALNERPEVQYATTAFNPGFPQYELDVDVAHCMTSGVQVGDVLDAMQVFYGGLYASNFNQFGKQYRVILQADTNYRAGPAGLRNISVRTSDGGMAPITEFITLKRVYGPESLSRFNLFTSISVNGAPNEGYSSGQCLRAIAETAATHLPPGYGFEYSGISREEEQSGAQALYVFVLCLAFVYLLLSAQYESYLLPFAVILSLPVGLSGVYVFAKLFGLDNNIYVQISLIMLVGLLSKNAILIVQFAVERRAKGMGIVEAALEGARARLRPILMTSFAFVFGLLPLMLSSGVGANGNRSIGTGAIGGMLFGTLLGVFVIPTLYILFQSLQERIGKKPVPPARPATP